MIGFAVRHRIDSNGFVNIEADIGGLTDSTTGQGLAAVRYWQI
ncbi:MAG TPA: hypothetical protein VI256_02270 [Roseiarcus sp.]